MHPVEAYLKELRDIHSTGAAVKETSYYPALSSLLNEIGKHLTPKVRCIINLANQGKGMPDGGLFTKEQFGKASDLEPKSGQKPARGAIEVKGWADDLDRIKQTDQVAKYLAEYRLLLLTNLRDFLLLKRDPGGPALELERCTLADGEGTFRDLLAHPQKAEKEHGERLTEYLKRVLLTNAPLAAPQDVAYFLASYAREARLRVESAPLESLDPVRESLQAALGMRFEGEKGEHFFRSTLVQTLFYGVFSAWVLWHRERPGRTDPFDWRAAEWTLHVPFISALYEEFIKTRTMKPLHLQEVLDWTAAALNRVDRGEFFRHFQDEEAVQYFYEPFLQAFDPDLRKELGVWYTPPEIVKYQVARVDTVLKEELDLPDGLADPSVVVLDPCCGTGAYLVEVLRHIGQTLQERGGDALTAGDLKKAAMGRVFGFEILPAPFVVAHLQLGLLLQRFGAPLSSDRDERVGVYLTNALTGWDELKVAEHTEMEFMKELRIERDAACRVKRDERILVVLGNPPYNAFAGTSPEEERGLVEPYKEGLNAPTAQGGWGIKKFNLDDLYVRFFRLAERRIAEMSGRGVVSFISNFSYLGDPSFVVMRKRFLDEFDSLWFDCMNGDSRQTGKLTPEGKPDPSVFSTEYNREGIRVGTTVGVIVRKAKRGDPPVVRFRHFWGTTKRKDLLDSLQEKDFNAAYTHAHPTPENRYSFRPEEVSSDYNSWPTIPSLAICHFNGPVERRAFALISMDKDKLEYRINAYFNSAISNEEIKAIYPSLMMTGNRIVGPEARKKILSEHKFHSSKIVKYPFKVFDIRWCYLDNLRPLFSEPSPDLIACAFPANRFFITRDSADKDPEGPPFYFSAQVCDYDSISGHARHFPLYLRDGKDKAKHHIPNISELAREYLSGIGDQNHEFLWLHALAIGYSPAYLTENADGIRRDWPRIPLPKSREVLEAGAELGRKVAALLNTEAEVPGVTTGALDPIFKTVGVLTKVGGGALGPEKDLAITAGWGHAGKGGVTMPAKGRIIERAYDEEEKIALDAAAQAQGLTHTAVLDILGPKTRDIYLNDTAYWKNVPNNVWEFYIGGYQVIKKWLSYREHQLLGRPLTPDEARHITATARRLAALRLMQPALDRHYQSSKA